MGLGRASLSFTVLEPVKVPQAESPRWAVLGRSNVGKSSFLNALIHPEVYFRVGARPGVTRGLIGVNVQMGASEKSILQLVDFPGFGYAKKAQFEERRRWVDLAEALREKSPHPGLLWIWLADPERIPEDDEVELLKWLNQEPFSFVFTKADQVGQGKRAQVEKKWKPFIEGASEGPYWVSSMNGEGFKEIQKSARSFVRGVYEAEKI